MATKQQLAFIRRYTCLYTRDLTKKAKAWQDGYLVFHHLNAKMILLSDNFVVLDECFFRGPGLNVMRDIPKEYKVPSDTSVTFSKYLSTLDEAVFEEEKDISEIYEKKRKHATDLDDFVESDDDNSQSRPSKRSHATATPARQHTPLPAAAGPTSGWLYRIRSDDSQRASPAHNGPLGNPGGPPLARAQPIGNQSTPLRPQAALLHQRKAQISTPKTTTPFKPPSFVLAGPASSPVEARPTSFQRRTLGSTRPSSSLARQSLQAEWSKYAEQLPTSARKPKFTPKRTLLHGESLAKQDERRAAHLEQVKTRPEPEIIPLNQERRDGEPGDPSSWLFD